jgi:chorismate synthase
VLGGISTGQDITVSIAIKPTSSIRTPRPSIDKAGNPVMVETFGRHDPAWASAPRRSPKRCWRWC